MYLLKILFVITNITNNGEFTISGFQSKESCDYSIGQHEQDWSPYIKGYFKVPLGEELKITSIECQKDSV